MTSPFAPTFAQTASTPETPQTTALIETLNLQPHPEGGYFAETDRDAQRVPNPFLHASDSAASPAGPVPRPGADAVRHASTTIYYLLTPASSYGTFHRNKGRTVHTLHRGRGRYVILHADEEARPARLETFVVGQDVERGERLQWIVEGGKYKASFLLDGGEGVLLISEVSGSLGFGVGEVEVADALVDCCAGV